MAELARATGLPAALVGLLAARGFRTPERIDRFLKPRLSDLADPGALPGMDRAVARIAEAIGRQEGIAIYGDYDVDGVSSTALLMMVLNRLGARVTPYLPNRIEEGYGLSVEALARCVESCHPNLLITVDCGTGAQAAVERAGEMGLDVIVTDHHELAGTLAKPIALVNPKLGTDLDTRMLAGVGVAFKVCHALVKYGREQGLTGADEIDLREYLDLVALGTIADVVPLLGENRILSSHGLACLNQRARIGLKALADVAGVDGELGTYHVGYVLGPRMNAVGRLGAAETALELLLTEHAARARSLAATLDAANRERKRIESDILQEAIRRIDAVFDPLRHFGIVVGEEGWHVGVIGIVASRLSARYDRPAVVVAFEADGTGRGSCRSVEGLDLMASLKTCEAHLTSYGGHEMAAGLALTRTQFEAFGAAFDAACAAELRGREDSGAQHLDAWLTMADVLDEDFMEALERLRPFGEGNPEPIWGLHGVRVTGEPRVVGGSHLKMTVAVGRAQCEAIGFGMGDREIPSVPLDVAFTLRKNEYQGRETVQLRLEDFRPA
jgi:single-stranded-DNA-specific exonuclease